MKNAIYMGQNIHWHEGEINLAERESLLSQKGIVLWFTGLSASGKSTIARRLEAELYSQKKLVYVLDGDNIRHGLNKDLGFSAQDREENIRRIGEVSHLFQDAGVIVLTAFISPYRRDRDMVRALLPENRFWEVFVHAPLAICEERDPKGLYKKARMGEIPEFTGVSAPYEEPESPELVLDTEKLDPKECVDVLIKKLKENEFI